MLQFHCTASTSHASTSYTNELLDLACFCIFAGYQLHKSSLHHVAQSLQNARHGSVSDHVYLGWSAEGICLCVDEGCSACPLNAHNIAEAVNFLSLPCRQKGQPLMFADSQSASDHAHNARNSAESWQPVTHAAASQETDARDNTTLFAMNRVAAGCSEGHVPNAAMGAQLQQRQHLFLTNF